MLAAEEVDRASCVASVNAYLEWRRFREAAGADDIRRELLPAGDTTCVFVDAPLPLEVSWRIDALESHETSAEFAVS